MNFDGLQQMLVEYGHFLACLYEHTGRVIALSPSPTSTLAFGGGIGNGIGISKMLVLHLSFSCDWQGAVRQAVLYAHRSCLHWSVVCFGFNGPLRQYFVIIFKKDFVFIVTTEV